MSKTDTAGARGNEQRPGKERAEEGNQARPDTRTEQGQTAKEARPRTDNTVNSTDRTPSADQDSGSRKGAGHPAGERKTAGDEVATGSGPDRSSAASASTGLLCRLSPHRGSLLRLSGARRTARHGRVRSSHRLTPVAGRRARPWLTGLGTTSRALAEERPAGLTEKDNCGPVACARVRAKDESEVDPQQIKARPDEQETVNTHGTFEELGGRTEVTSKEQLDQSMAKAPVGTKVVVWVWKAGDKAAHLVYGEKARDGTHYYDSDSRAPLTKADADAALADAQAVTVFGGGTAFRGGKASGPESVPSLPRYVGAGAVRADPMAARRFATARDGAESPSRPDVIAVHMPDGTFTFRTAEPPRKPRLRRRPWTTSSRSGPTAVTPSRRGRSASARRGRPRSPTSCRHRRTSRRSPRPSCPRPWPGPRCGA